MRIYSFPGIIDHIEVSFEWSLYWEGFFNCADADCIWDGESSIKIDNYTLEIAGLYVIFYEN